MANRVRNAAAEVLKEHQAGIKVNAEGLDGSMIIRPMGEATPEVLEEIESALAAMGAKGPNYHFGRQEGAVSLMGEYYIDDPEFLKSIGSKPTRFKNSIQQLATTLADAGINFPTSERFRSIAVEA